MARKYPHYDGYSRKLRGPSSNPCRVCGDPALVYATIQMTWTRGDDIEIPLCRKQPCREAARLNPAQYIQDGDQ